MKFKNTLFTALLFPLILLAGCATESSNRITRVACVGDSITQGVGVKDQSHDSYPAQLGHLLGDKWEVKNYGVSGTTMMNKGDRPYQRRAECQAAINSKPDVAIIALGTNDSKPQNAEAHPEDFIPSAHELIAKFRQANPRVKIYLCLPVPAFPEHWGIRDSVITNQIIPQLTQVAQQDKVSVIDLHTALAGKGWCFPDKVHPNETGAALMAEAVTSALLKNSKMKLK
jgi:acyl-CoA thioesterase I